MHPKSLRAWTAFKENVEAQEGVVLEPRWLGARVGHLVRCREGHEHTPMPTNVARGGGICLTCAGQSPEAAHRAFVSRVEELRGRVVEPVWLGAAVRHRIVCAAGHRVTAHPNFVRQGGGICGVCAGRDPETLLLALRDRVEELGGVLLETEWLGSVTGHRVRCSEKHERSPRPADVRVGGLCGICAGNDTTAARAAFVARVAELGAELLDVTWRGVDERYRVRCSRGHTTWPLPSSVRAGGGICRVCSGRDGEAAWESFRGLVTELHGEVLEPRWRGTATPHRVRCAHGHESFPTPGNVRRRGSFCPTCAGQDAEAAWQFFRDRVEEQDGEVLEQEWLGSAARHGVRCAEGHETTAHPGSVRNGGGICAVCAGTAPGVAWESFRAAVEAVGATVLEEDWRGATARHRIRCGQGHETAPYPTLVQQGGAVCRICSGRAWDVLYIVTDPTSGEVKVGVSTGSGKPRLRVHARDGFTTVLHLTTGLPAGTAFDHETRMLRELCAAGHRPVRGREYSAASALPLILDVAPPRPSSE